MKIHLTGLTRRRWSYGAPGRMIPSEVSSATARGPDSGMSASLPQAGYLKLSATQEIGFAPDEYAPHSTGPRDRDLRFASTGGAGGADAITMM
jgi:hypothetical protein